MFLAFARLFSACRLYRIKVIKSCLPRGSVVPYSLYSWGQQEARATPFRQRRLTHRICAMPTILRWGQKNSLTFCKTFAALAACLFFGSTALFLYRSLSAAACRAFGCRWRITSKPVEHRCVICFQWQNYKECLKQQYKSTIIFYNLTLFNRNY